MTIIPWANGCSMVWDATCVDTLASTYLRKSAMSPRSAAEMAAKKKHEKYSNLKRDGYIFIPVAVETMGPWASEGRRLFDMIGSQLREVTGDRKASFYFSQRISLAIQRGNGATVVGCVPEGDSMDGVLDLC